MDPQELEARNMNRDPKPDAAGAQQDDDGVGAAAGVGAAVGAVAGAVAGTAVAGPVGTAVGGVVGAAIGAVTGVSVGESTDALAEDAHWRSAYRSEPYYNKDFTYEDYWPAYFVGYNNRMHNKERSWDQACADAQAEWELTKGASRLPWNDAQYAVRAGWHRVAHPIAAAPGAIAAK